LLSLLCGTLVSATVLVSSAPSGAAPISVLRSKAHNLAVQIDTTQQRIEILSEEYDQASGHAAQLKSVISTDTASLNAAQSTVSHDGAALRTQAVDAYVDAGSTGSLPAVLSNNAGVLPLRQTYLSAAAGSVDTAIAALENSEVTLHNRRAVLNSAVQRANATTATLGNAQSQAEALQDSLNRTLAGVQGNLAAAVNAQERAVEAAAERQAAATAAAARAATTPVYTPPAATLTDSGSSGGAGSAVHAAESQMGVPYVWAGATPGEGFDCSGLTMWAWGQAGVNLPHSAEAQYDSIEHVPFSDLEPGDLIFYSSGGYIYHVVMYIGGGQVVQAEETGTPVQVTSVPPGAYAAGRP
jgi:cell wall-associated NlpC family hydrolase